MLNMKPGLPDTIPAFHATGTILAGDIRQLFSTSPIAEKGRLYISIDADFDGYLSEVGNGLTHETKDHTSMRTAVVMPAGMMPEAASAGMRADGQAVRAFAVEDDQAAIEWLTE